MVTQGLPAGEREEGGWSRQGSEGQCKQSLSSLHTLHLLTLTCCCCQSATGPCSATLPCSAPLLPQPPPLQGGADSRMVQKDRQLLAGNGCCCCCCCQRARAPCAAHHPPPCSCRSSTHIPKVTLGILEVGWQESHRRYARCSPIQTRLSGASRRGILCTHVCRLCCVRSPRSVDYIAPAPGWITMIQHTLITLAHRLARWCSLVYHVHGALFLVLWWNALKQLRQVQSMTHTHTRCTVVHVPWQVLLMVAAYSPLARALLPAAGASRGQRD
jgi:hypothetical protein